MYWEDGCTLERSNDRVWHFALQFPSQAASHVDLRMRSVAVRGAGYVVLFAGMTREGLRLVTGNTVPFNATAHSAFWTRVTVLHAILLSWCDDQLTRGDVAKK